MANPSLDADNTEIVQQVLVTGTAGTATAKYLWHINFPVITSTGVRRVLSLVTDPAAPLTERQAYLEMRRLGLEFEAEIVTPPAPRPKVFQGRLDITKTVPTPLAPTDYPTGS